jgi:hypothetical protein
MGTRANSGAASRHTHKVRRKRGEGDRSVYTHNLFLTPIPHFLIFVDVRTFGAGVRERKEAVAGMTFAYPIFKEICSEVMGEEDHNIHLYHFRDHPDNQEWWEQVSVRLPWLALTGTRWHALRLLCCHALICRLQRSGSSMEFQAGRPGTFLRGMRASSGGVSRRLCKVRRRKRASPPEANSSSPSCSTLHSTPTLLQRSHPWCRHPGKEGGHCQHAHRNLHFQQNLFCRGGGNPQVLIQKVP